MLGRASFFSKVHVTGACKKTLSRQFLWLVDGRQDKTRRFTNRDH